ncbi:MAG: hypothetical protein IJ237_06415 [Oscillospiraceae bacterium]|nr:hypothetical protein [Oscillospiraceae bacterium]
MEKSAANKAIGLDIGTTTISAVVIEGRSGTVLESRTVSNNSFLPNRQEWEKAQDANLIIEKVKRVLEELLEKHDDISVIGLTGQMHGIVYTGSHGEPVSPLFTWQDRRGILPCFDGKSICSLLEERNGIKAFTGYGLVTHLYHCLNGSVPESAESFCTIGDAVGMALTGRTKPLMHSSNAASLGLFDTEANCFLSSVLREYGAEENMLPDVTPDYTYIGTYRGTPVCSAIGDNQASFLGTVRDAEDTILVNMGTGGQISVFSRALCKAPGIEARPIFRDAYLLVGSSLCGGRAYAVVKEFFQKFAQAAGLPELDVYAVMAHLLETEKKPPDSLQVSTLFDGTRADPALRGSIGNISVENFTPANLIDGVLSGMAEELYQYYSSIQKETGLERSRLLASGNGLRKNVFLQQKMSERFGMPLTVSEQIEEAACGAALAGLAAVGAKTVDELVGSK